MENRGIKIGVARAFDAESRKNPFNAEHWV